MRHPFAEIIRATKSAAETATEFAVDPKPTRRSVLGGFLSVLAGATGLLNGRLATADSPEEKESEKSAPAAKDEGTGKAADGYRLYLAVPRQIRKFTTKRRAELGIGGPYTHGWEGNENWKDSRGFLAWLNADQAKKVRDADDVAAVHEITQEDKKATGQPNRRSGKLIVRVGPNPWAVKPDAETYYSVKQIVDGWSKKFADMKDVKFSTGAGGIEVKFDHGKVNQKVIEGITAHPQVGLLAWADGPTTKALGEEGGVTTAARFEEGGPTTRRRGEEGGGPRPTTLRVGEEGGWPRPTTKAIGEEGGRPRPKPAPRPIPRPIPKKPPTVTTLALGEEG